MSLIIAIESNADTPEINGNNNKKGFAQHENEKENILESVSGSFAEINSNSEFKIIKYK